MSVPLARKVALQHYGFSANPKRKPSNVEVNVYRSFGTGGWERAPDGGRPAALERLVKLVGDHWDEHVGTMSRYGRLSMAQLRYYADTAYGDPLAGAEQGGGGSSGSSGKAHNGPTGPKAGAAPAELLEPWLKALCDESPAHYLVELIGKEGRHLLLVNTAVRG